MKNEINIEVGPLRVWQQNLKYPGLAMTRSFGDTMGRSAGIICEPEILDINLKKNSKIIIIASDGIWEYLENS